MASIFRYLEHGSISCLVTVAANGSVFLAILIRLSLVSDTEIYLVGSIPTVPVVLRFSLFLSRPSDAMYLVESILTVTMVFWFRRFLPRPSNSIFASRVFQRCHVSGGLVFSFLDPLTRCISPRAFSRCHWSFGFVASFLDPITRYVRRDYSKGANFAISSFEHALSPCCECRVC